MADKETETVKENKNLDVQSAINSVHIDFCDTVRVTNGTLKYFLLMDSFMWLIDDKDILHKSMKSIRDQIETLLIEKDKKVQEFDREERILYSCAFLPVFYYEEIKVKNVPNKPSNIDRKQKMLLGTTKYEPFSASQKQDMAFIIKDLKSKGPLECLKMHEAMQQQKLGLQAFLEKSFKEILMMNKQISDLVIKNLKIDADTE